MLKSITEVKGNEHEKKKKDLNNCYYLYSGLEFMNSLHYLILFNSQNNSDGESSTYRITGSSEQLSGPAI